MKLFRLFAFLAMASILISCSNKAAIRQKEKINSTIIEFGKIEAATEVGVTYINFLPLVASAKAKLTETEPQIKDSLVYSKLQCSMSAYIDAVIIWKESYSEDDVYSYKVENADATLLTRRNKVLGIAKSSEHTFSRKTALSALWQEASKCLKEAREIHSKL